MTDARPVPYSNSPSPLSIRPVHLTDAASLHSMCWADRTPEQVAELLHKTVKLAEAGRGLGAVGLWDGVLCAFGLLTLWPRVAEISDLVVNASYRSQGIGSHLIAFLSHTARDMHASTLEIGAALSNPRALSLYRRLGFVEGRILELDLGDGPEPVQYLYKPVPPGDQAC
jgi:ribosomal protein S18 acetylase RimI-like enzyme